MEVTVVAVEFVELEDNLNVFAPTLKLVVGAGF